MSGKFVFLFMNHGLVTISDARFGRHEAMVRPVENLTPPISADCLMRQSPPFGWSVGGVASVL
ncbi:MAG TPA: hypothetical protein VL527_09155 [Dongiaceae bacterium]|jgi:hypothetical protein|nr:hypothetical protein [Dongiaceae bacterium]